jgi:hypothetical protein
MAHICCSPPERVPALWFLRSAVAILRHTVAVGALVGAHLEVLLHAHAWKEAPALGRLRDTHLHHVVRGLLGDVAALEVDPPLARMVEPVDGTKRGRLAGTVGADQRHDLALTHVERDPLERVNRAVVRMDIFDRQDDCRLLA